MQGAGKLLGAVGIFADVPEDDIVALTKASRSVRLVPGEVLMCAGDTSDDVYVVTDGRLGVSRHENGRDVHVGDVLPGECVGEMALVRDAPRTATVSALEDSTVLEVPGSRLRELMGSDKAFRAAVQAHAAHIDRWTDVRRYRPNADEVVDHVVCCRHIGRAAESPGTTIAVGGDATRDDIDGAGPGRGSPVLRGLGAPDGVCEEG